MRVKFIGVGEAFDEVLPNTSVWIREEREGQRSSVLLDCGFTVPHYFWRTCPAPDELDAVWISHFHGDHYFGIPALLTRFWESKRKKPLLILGQEGVDEMIEKIMRLAYSSILDKLGFDLRFKTVEPGSPTQAAGLTWSTAATGHPQRDLAVRIESRGKSVFYSGDGPGTDETLALARECDLLIHEAFLLDRNIPGHGNIMSCIDFAEKAGARSLAIVHIQRGERRERRAEIVRVMESVKDVRVFMPEPGDDVEV